MKNFQEDKSDYIITSICELSRVPVINLESGFYHPCQSTADMMTIKEKLGSIKGKKVVLTWANHPRVLPMAVPNSFALAASQCGAHLTIAHPKKYNLDEDLIETCQKFALEQGGSVSVAYDMKQACDSADVIYAKSWGSIQYYGDPEKELKDRKELDPWIVDGNIMRGTAQGAGIFMHCLPIRRNVIATDEVLDSKQSVVVDQAENRLFAQMALLNEIAKGSHHLKAIEDQKGSTTKFYKGFVFSHLDDPINEVF